jgi:hypothetical protein
MRAWARDRSLGILFVTLFVTSWIAQLYFEWQVFVDEQRAHDAPASFWSAAFWEAFGQSTFENWQSEFLQLIWQAAGLALFYFWGSSQSRESDERIEAKVDRLLRERGVDPATVVDEPVIPAVRPS